MSSMKVEMSMRRWPTSRTVGMHGGTRGASPGVMATGMLPQSMPSSYGTNSRWLNSICCSRATISRVVSGRLLTTRTRVPAGMDEMR